MACGEVPLVFSHFCIKISPQAWTAIICLFFFSTLWGCLWNAFRKGNYYYFDAQDFAAYESGGRRKLPVSAQTGTFTPLLKGYLGVTKLLITVAAASIAFGTDKNAALGIFLAKIILAFAILYGTLFAALLQFFYEEYAQNVQSYKPWRYTLVQALGFSALVSFFVGYLVWAFNLS